jgi:hypothetical protein
MLKKIGIFLLILYSLSSCMTSRRMASQYITKENNINVLILPPSGLIKQYRGISNTSNPDSLQTFSLAESMFLDNFNDTAYVNYFIRSLKYHLSGFQVNVFGPENLDSFFLLDTTAYIFSVAQMELLEFQDKYQQLTEVDTVVYSINLPRNNVENSVWFEFSELNNQDRSMQVLYSLQSSGDFYDGKLYYDWRSGDVTFRYTTHRLEEADVYDLAYFAGLKNAQYIFDFLMNVYIADKLDRKRPITNYYQYDRDSHSIRRALDDRFIIMPAPPPPPAPPSQDE